MKLVDETCGPSSSPSPWRVRSEEILGRLGEIKRQESALASERFELLAELKTLRTVDPEITLTREGLLSRREARDVVSRSSAVEVAPLFGEALSHGDISVAHVDGLSRALKIVGEDKALLLEKIESLASAACHMTPDEFGRHACDTAKSIMTDDGIGVLERQRRETHLKIWNDLDGMVHIRAQFDPERGAVLQSLIARRVESMFHSGDNDTKMEVAPGIEPNHHRNALALIGLVSGCIDTDERPVRAELVVHVDLATLQKGRHETTVCRTSYGSDLPIETVRRLSCEAEVIPVVLDGRSVPLDVGRAKRLATAHQRRALEAIYETCAIDGCDRAFHMCNVHHIKYWENGGKTDLNNMVPLCTQHHHAAHEGGWKLRLDPMTRRLTVT